MVQHKLVLIYTHTKQLITNNLQLIRNYIPKQMYISIIIIYIAPYVVASEAVKAI